VETATEPEILEMIALAPLDALAVLQVALVETIHPIRTEALVTPRLAVRQEASAAMTQRQILTDLPTPALPEAQEASVLRTPTAPIRTAALVIPQEELVGGTVVTMTRPTPPAMARAILDPTITIMTTVATGRVVTLLLES